MDVLQCGRNIRGIILKPNKTDELRINIHLYLVCVDYLKIQLRCEMEKNYLNNQIFRWLFLVNLIV